MENYFVMYIKFTQLYIYIYIYICICICEVRFLRQFISDFEQISLHKLFPVYAMIYTAVLRGGMMKEREKPPY